VQLERDLISHQEKYQRENTMIRITPFETRQSPNISSQLMETLTSAFCLAWYSSFTDVIHSRSHIGMSF
ncbi:hypothetical protein INN84_16590, partial [Staphylococcus aureus]|nr:hypothetical protein [Staphylococcus aureus]